MLQYLPVTRACVRSFWGQQTFNQIIFNAVSSSLQCQQQLGKVAKHMRGAISPLGLLVRAQEAASLADSCPAKASQQSISQVCKGSCPNLSSLSNPVSHLYLASSTHQAGLARRPWSA